MRANNERVSDGGGRTSRGYCAAIVGAWRGDLRVNQDTEEDGRVCVGVDPHRGGGDMMWTRRDAPAPISAERDALGRAKCADEVGREWGLEYVGFVRGGAGLMSDGQRHGTSHAEDQQQTADHVNHSHNSRIARPVCPRCRRILLRRICPAAGRPHVATSSPSLLSCATPPSAFSEPRQWQHAPSWTSPCACEGF
jgi:hypothetical protein